LKAQEPLISEYKQFLISRQPILGVSADGHHPLHRGPWWSEVYRSDPRFDTLVDNFQGSLIGHKNRQKVICDVPQLKVVRIEQRFNPTEAYRYDKLLRSSRSGECFDDLLLFQSRDEFVVNPWQRIRNTGDEYNEIFGWHGTAKQNSLSLEAEGFNMHRVHAGKGLYGDGMYFSPHASKSDMYQRTMDGHPKTIYMVRLNMGRVKHISRTNKGTRGPSAGFNSTRAIGGVDNPTLNDEYIIFDGARAQIAYKFTYYHQSCCKCALCSA
jgi:hypothetical protein